MTDIIKSVGQLWYLYQARRVATQANAGGGAIIVDVALASGQIARGVMGRVILGSANNGISLNVVDEDNSAAVFIGTVATGANRNAQFPSVGQTVGMDNASFTGNLYLGPGQKFSSANMGVGAAGDTMTLAIQMWLNTPVEPTWSKERSTNPADVTLAASTISAANTMRGVLL